MAGSERGDRRADLEAAARALIERARRHELGVDILVQGYPESIASLHGVHPDVVHTARRLLAGQGRTIPPVPHEAPARRTPSRKKADRPRPGLPPV